MHSVRRRSLNLELEPHPSVSRHTADHTPSHVRRKICSVGLLSQAHENTAQATGQHPWFEDYIDALIPLTSSLTIRMSTPSTSSLFRGEESANCREGRTSTHIHINRIDQQVVAHISQPIHVQSSSCSAYTFSTINSTIYIFEENIGFHMSHCTYIIP